MAEFKKIADVDVLDELNENDNVLIVDANGALKQTSSSNLGTDLTKTEVVDELEEDDKIIIVGANGALKQTPSANLGKGGYVLKLTFDNFGEVNYTLQCSENYDALYEAAMAGSTIWLDFSEVERGGYLYMEPVGSLSLDRAGLWVDSWNHNVLLPNGSYHHNFPEEE